MNKQAVVEHLRNKTANLIPHCGKSEVWKTFQDIEKTVDGKTVVIKDFVACKTCKAVYHFSSSSGKLFSIFVDLSIHLCDAALILPYPTYMYLNPVPIPTQVQRLSVDIGAIKPM